MLTVIKQHSLLVVTSFFKKSKQVISYHSLDNMYVHLNPNILRKYCVTTYPYAIRINHSHLKLVS